MRSFTTIATFASIAFAAVASALPTGPGSSYVEPPPEALPYIHNHASPNTIKPGAATGVENRAIGSFEAYAVNAAISARNDEAPRGIPDVITELNDKILPLCHDLNGKVKDAPSADVGLTAAIEILGQIKEHLATAKGEIEPLVANPVEAVFYLKGKLVDAHAIAEIVAVLTISVTTVVGFVLKALISVRTDALINLVNEIVGLLAAIIGLVLEVVAGLLADLTPLLHCIKDIIVELKLTALIDVLKLAVKA